MKLVNFSDYLSRKEIIKKFNILSFKELQGGLINKTYKLITKNGIYVIKILNHYYTNNIERYEFTEKISNICDNNNINVASAIKINGKYVNKIENYYVMVFNYIEGYSLNICDIKNEHVIEISKMLGKIHKINYHDNYKNVIRYSIDWKKIVEIPDFNNTIYKDYYLNNYQKYYEIFDKVIGIKNAKTVKLGICHRDIKSSNVIWKNNNPYLIDFESARVDDIEVDLIETMLRWTGFLNFQIDYDKISLFINEYKKYIDISDINFTEVLYANLLGRFDFLYYNLDITLLNKTDDLKEYNSASKEVINMINEINYYLYIIDELSKFLSNFK